MDFTGKTFALAPDSETGAREREVQLLLNVVEPDPEFQPFILTDEASLMDAVGTDRGVMKSRLCAYFGADLELDLRMPIWQLVDHIKRLRPDWPEEP